MKKVIAVVLVLVLAAGGAGGFYYWKQKKEGAAVDGRISSSSEAAVYVDSVSVLAGLGSGNGVIQRYAGVIEPQQTWEVKLENERSVKECFVKEGDEVKDGQKLFVYDTTEDEDNLAKSEIELERYENEIETSKAQKEQLEKEKTKASADEQLDYTTRILTAENNIKQNEYEYKAKELEIKQLKEKIADAAVYSEMDGVVKSINDSNDSNGNGYGYMSDSSDSAYITILQVGDFRVKGTVNEQNKDQIYDGMEMLVHSRVDETVIWHGVITEIKLDKGENNSESSMYNYFGSDNSGSSTNYPFYVELDSSDGLILGQHVYLEPDQGQGEKKEGIWLYDYYFIQEENGDSYVWAASSSNTLEKRRVKLGEYDEEMAAYQVLEGLDAEDYIIVPSDDLAEGLPVIYNDYNSVSEDMEDFDSDGMDMDGYDFDATGMEYSDGDYDLSGMDYDEDDMDFDMGDYDEDEDEDEYDADEDMYDDEDYYDADAEDDEDFDEELQGLNEDGVSGMMSMLNGR